MEDSESKAQYEFRTHHEATIGELATQMQRVGWGLFGFGVLNVAAAVLLLLQHLKGGFVLAPLISHVASGFLCMVLGWFNMRTAKGFHLIVETRGRDIQHLMTALENQKTLYLILFYFVLFVIFIHMLGYLTAHYLPGA